ncbi:PREDICTED: VIN3-like protein 2, partial [Camelina sativa]|uniref:VIN3-like protein 2 n=1 Tax=Camelina sativa TaxID=90675 RepID=A0ABM1RC13_CAMSA
LLHAGGASTSKVIEISDDNKRRRKNTKPRHLSSYGKRTSKTSETDIKGKGKRVCIKTEFDVRQMKKNYSCGVVLKEPVMENFPIVTPLVRSDQINDRQDRPEKAKSLELFDFEHCVKLIRQLECSGHLESSFRQKFLTWFSLRATTEQISVVKTFIHSFQDDSVALAEQLVDIFSYCVSTKGSGTIGVGHGGGSSGASCKKPRH